MKKILSLTLSILCFATLANAAETIKLPKPETSGGKPLLEMIDQRRSMREFSNKEIDKQTLSNILWTAWGYNSAGKRTIPTARNQQNLKVFVFMKDGVWAYDAKSNSLDQITTEDQRALLAQQEYVLEAPLSLVYVGSDNPNSYLHAGSSYQNVSLYAKAKGLHAVVRGLIDRSELQKILPLEEKDEILVSITLGWPK